MKAHHQAACQAPIKQLQRTVIGRRVRRAANGSARPLNCGVGRHSFGRSISTQVLFVLLPAMLERTK
jgi:hypothetical protein